MKTGLTSRSIWIQWIRDHAANLCRWRRTPRNKCLNGTAYAKQTHLEIAHTTTCKLREKNKQVNKQTKTHTQATIVCARYSRTTWREADGFEFNAAISITKTTRPTSECGRSPTSCCWKEEGQYNHCPKAYTYCDPSPQSRHRSLKSNLTFICYGWPSDSTSFHLLSRSLPPSRYIHMHIGYHLVFSSNHIYKIRKRASARHHTRIQIITDSNDQKSYQRPEKMKKKSLCLYVGQVLEFSSSCQKHRWKISDSARLTSTLLYGARTSGPMLMKV